MAEWYVQYDNGETEGPLSGVMLKQRASQGQITSETLVRTGDSGKWSKAAQVKGLFPSKMSEEDICTLIKSDRPLPRLPPSTQPPENTPVSHGNGKHIPTNLPATPADPKVNKRPAVGLFKQVRPFLYPTSFALLLVATTVIVTLWVTGGGSKNAATETTPQASLPVQTTPAEEPPKETPPEKNPVNPVKAVYTVKGEILVITKAGDVKKAAALKVSFVPVPEEIRSTLLHLHQEAVKIDTARESFHASMEKTAPPYPDLTGIKDSITRWKLQDEHTQAMKKYFAESDVTRKKYFQYLDTTYGPQIRPVLLASHKLLSENVVTTVTNGDGAFSLELPSGNYILLTEQYAIRSQKLVWCKAVNVSPSLSPLILDHRAAIFGKDTSTDDALDVSKYEVLHKVGVELSTQ